eukprot:gene20717-biopygen10129
MPVHSIPSCPAARHASGRRAPTACVPPSRVPRPPSPRCVFDAAPESVTQCGGNWPPQGCELGSSVSPCFASKGW